MTLKTVCNERMQSISWIPGRHSARPYMTEMTVQKWGSKFWTPACKNNEFILYSLWPLRLGGSVWGIFNLLILCVKIFSKAIPISSPDPEKNPVDYPVKNTASPLARWASPWHAGDWNRRESVVPDRFNRIRHPGSGQKFDRQFQQGHGT
jgi:hypothetical protein